MWAIYRCNSDDPMRKANSISRRPKRPVQAMYRPPQVNVFLSDCAGDRDWRTLVNLFDDNKLRGPTDILPPVTRCTTNVRTAHLPVLKLSPFGRRFRNMPELPEVETVVRGLRTVLTGETIAHVTSYAPPTSVALSPSFGRRSFDRVLRGRTIRSVSRRGKNILISLSGDITLWVHLKMTGRFLYIEKTAPINKHDLVLFDLASGGNGNALHIRFNDYRRFGRLRVFPDYELWQQDGLRDLGPEPLEISADEFVARCHTRARMLKAALLDQSFLAGLGNIYADESLYYSRLHPKRPTTSVSRRKLIELHGHIQALLRRAIDAAGTSVDTYSGVNGRPGTFQRHLKAYNREGEPCERCGMSIVRERIGARSAHYCRRCQRLR